MHWRASILVMVALVAPFIAADECDPSDVYQDMDIVKKLVQEWKSSKNHTSHQLLGIMDRFETLAKHSRKLKKVCDEDRQFKYDYMLQFSLSLLSDIYPLGEGMFGLMERDNMDPANGTSFVCTFDCNIVLNFAHQSRNADLRRHVYNILTNIVKYADLSNRATDVGVRFIKLLHKHVGEERDENVVQAMKTLLHQAIKTDLILQHHNSEALYAIDKKLTSAVIQELITENLNLPFKDHAAIEDFPLFEILKCPDQLPLWIEHLQMVFNELKKHDKMKSVYSLILLKNINLLKEKVQEEDKHKLASMEKELPVVLQKLLDAELCIQFYKDKKNKAFISSNDEIKKFVPKADGSVTLINAHMGDEHYTLLVEKTDELEGVFDFKLEAEFGELEPLTAAEYCNVVSNVCTPYADALPQTDLNAKHFALYKKYVKFSINQKGPECTNKILRY